MNLGQTMITLGMFILLIMTVISANRMLMENSEAQVQAEAVAASASIASDLFAEILSKPYDHAVVVDTTTNPWKQDTTGTLVTSASSFTSATDSLHQWGCTARHLVSLPDSSYIGNYKSITALKDIDDYDEYSRIVSYGAISGFQVSVRVYYVASTSPDVISSGQQFLKKITITVQQPQYMTSDLRNVATYTALASY